MRLSISGKSKTGFVLLLIGAMIIMPRMAVADETTFIIDTYQGERGASSLIDTAEGLLAHDRIYGKAVNEVAEKYRQARAPREKVLVRLDYVEVRALHLKGWIVGMKKLKRLSSGTFLRESRDLSFSKKWRSPEGKTALNGLYNGASVLLVMSSIPANRKNDVEAKIKNLTDQVILMEVSEYYRLMDDVDSLRRVIRSEKKFNTAFNKNLVFLSQELKHLKNWYVKHARQG